MEVYDAIRVRKSVRSFKDRPIEQEKMDRILEAARLAPSARNSQEWRFIVVTDPETRSRLSQAAKGQRSVAEAPAVLVCCAVTDKRVMSCGHYLYTIDRAIATDQITLAAVSEGLGTCWIGAFYQDPVREILGIPESVEVVELLPIGYPQDPSEVRKDRKGIEEIVCYERWSLT